MSRRSEVVVIVYTLAVVLLTFVQAAHDAGWDPLSAPATPLPVLIARWVQRGF